MSVVQENVPFWNFRFWTADNFWPLWKIMDCSRPLKIVFTILDWSGWTILDSSGAFWTILDHLDHFVNEPKPERYFCQRHSVHIFQLVGAKEYCSISGCYTNLDWVCHPPLSPSKTNHAMLEQFAVSSNVPHISVFIAIVKIISLFHIYDDLWSNIIAKKS